MYFTNLRNGLMEASLIIRRNGFAKGLLTQSLHESSPAPSTKIPIYISCMRLGACSISIEYNFDEWQADMIVLRQGGQ